MRTTVNVKGQVTIPKQMRDALGLTPGSQLDFSVNHEGQVVLRRAGSDVCGSHDRFAAVRGKADVHWKTDNLMALLRAD